MIKETITKVYVNGVELPFSFEELLKNLVTENHELKEKVEKYEKAEELKKKESELIKLEQKSKDLLDALSHLSEVLVRVDRVYKGSDPMQLIYNTVYAEIDRIETEAKKLKEDK